jgi:hypothetical protein
MSDGKGSGAGLTGLTVSPLDCADEAFGESLTSDVIVYSSIGTMNRRDDTLAAFGRGFIRYSRVR